MFEGPNHDKDGSLGLTHPSRPISFFAAAAWTIAVGFVLQVAVQITDGARPGAAVDMVNLTACFVLAYSVLLFAILRVYAPDASVREVLGVRVASPLATLLAVAAGVALCPALGVVDDYMTKRFPPAQEDTDVIEKLLQASTLAERIVLVVALSVVIPLSKEIFFRGALFGGLRRGRAEGLAVLGSAAFFAMSQLDPRSFLTSLVLGLFASWLRGRSGSIVPAALAVIAYNAAEVVPDVLGKGEVSFGPRVAGGGAVAAAVLSWGAGMIFARDRRAETGRLLDA